MITAFAVITAGMCVANAQETDYHSLPHETKYSNVALYKSVTASENFSQEMYAYPMFSLDKMVDGNLNTCALGTIPQDGWVQVDLEKRYKLKKITLTDRYDTDQGGVRTNTKILASNDENFSEYDVLDSIGATENGFTYRNAWEINLDGTKAYRYVRIHRDAPAYGGYGELQVFADFHVTEVSKGKPATANAWYDDGVVSCPPEKVLDDVETNIDGWFCFLDVVGRQYNYLQVDLQTPEHIGFIKMTPRHADSIGSENIYQAFDFYGSHDPIDTDEEKAFVTAPEAANGLRQLTENDGYYTLASVPTADRYVGGFNSPDYPMAYNRNFEQAVSDVEAYQYITYAHTYQLNSQIGTLGLYVINPEVDTVSVNGTQFTVSFSDKMDFSNPSEFLEISDENGVIYPIANVTNDDYSVSFSANLPLGEELTLTVKKEAKNSYGIPMVEDVAQSFATPPAIEINGFSFVNFHDAQNTPLSQIGTTQTLGACVTISNNTADKTENAVLFILLYNENGTLIGAEEKLISALPGSVETHKIGIAIPSQNVRAKAFLWQNYQTMKNWTDMITIQ